MQRYQACQVEGKAARKATVWINQQNFKGFRGRRGRRSAVAPWTLNDIVLARSGTSRPTPRTDLLHSALPRRRNVRRRNDHHTSTTRQRAIGPFAAAGIPARRRVQQLLGSAWKEGAVRPAVNGALNWRPPHRRVLRANGMLLVRSQRACTTLKRGRADNELSSSHEAPTTVAG